MKDFGLVVIGAHFGVWLEDKINECGSDNILLVEPVPYNNRILKKNFSERKNIFICENAIFSENKIKKFFFVKEKSIRKLGKHWASGIGSFDKQHILNHRNKRFLISNEDIEEIDVEFIDFDKLIEKYQIKSIKNLQIDVEGAEFEILKTIDFTKIDIKTLVFEAKHFDGTFFEGPKLKIVKEKLTLHGFEIVKIDKENILAKKN